MDRMVTISVRLSRDMVEALRRQARLEGTTVDALVRSCIVRKVQPRKTRVIAHPPSFAPDTDHATAIDPSQNGPQVYGATGSQSL